MADNRVRGESEGSIEPMGARDTENSIQPRQARTRRRANPQAAPTAEKELPAAPASRPAAAGSSDPWTMPASVRDRFTQEGHRFYFPDGAQAFRDHGRKLTTPSENTELIRSLVEIAKERGWDTIVIRGTERFRQEAWRQARVEGLEVRGYKPEQAERAALARALARRQESSQELPSPAPEPARDSADSAAKDPGGKPKRPTDIVGRLIDHGRDTYQFHPHGEISYFVRIDDGDDKRTLWGKDLERAMKESLSKPQVGDDIVIRRTGQENVTVKRRLRDADGAVTEEKDLATHRNQWLIEKREFMEARSAAAAVVRNPEIDPKAAVQSHPQLAGTYLNLHAAQIAAKTLNDPEDRKIFVDLIRGALADAIERGAPLQPVRLRERVSQRPNPSRTRETEAPTR